MPYFFFTCPYAFLVLYLTCMCALAHIIPSKKGTYGSKMIQLAFTVSSGVWISHTAKVIRSLVANGIPSPAKLW